MAASIHLDLASTRTLRLMLLVTVFLACSIAHAQDSKTYILAARRSGAIEIIDPKTLLTIGRIHFDLPPNSSGLNGISAGPDGTTLYVEGPIPKSSKFSDAAGGCCVLYSIDLTTMQTRQVAGVEGTQSRNAFVTFDGVTYPVAPSRGTPPHFPRGADELFDFAQIRIQSGMRMDGSDFLYGSKEDGSGGLLWSGLPGTLDLGHGVSVEPFAKVPGCSAPMNVFLAGAAGNLFLYEAFGWIGDRRNSCNGVPGGAWIIDPATGELLAHVGPDLYFSELVPDRDQGELCAISTDDPDWRTGVRLVRIDGQDGTILNSRVLESDFWRIALAPLRNPPAADVRALFPLGRRQ
jgi:hypothetical protein